MIRLLLAPNLASYCLMLANSFGECDVTRKNFVCAATRLYMRKIELTSKLVLALIATIVAFSAMTAPSVVAQPGPPQGVGGGPPIPDNSVTSEKIVDGEVQTEDIADGAVTSAKIADGTIQEQDIADGVIPSDGGAGQLVVTERSEVSEGVNPNTNVLIGVNCNSDEIPTGGGFGGFGFGDEVWVQSSSKGGSEGNGWQVALTYVSGPVPRDVTVYAECAKIVP